MDFIIQKLKNKHTSLKEYTNWAEAIYFSLVLREWEEKKKLNISHQGDNNEIDAGQCDQKPVEYVSHGTHAQYNNGQ